MRRKSQAEATLIDVLIDGFEKNEVLGGFHWRNLPMLDVRAAVGKFEALCEEAHRWKGAPIDEIEEPDRRLAAWRDLEILQAGRGVMVRVAAPSFDGWWNASETWSGDPMAAAYAWLAERRGARRES